MRATESSHIIIVANADEVAVILVFEGNASGAADFFTDHQIKCGQTMVLLRPGQHIDGMIGREHNYHLLGASIIDLACEFFGVCGRRECEVMDIQVETASIYFASDLDPGANCPPDRRFS